MVKSLRCKNQLKSNNGNKGILVKSTLSGWLVLHTECLGARSEMRPFETTNHI